MSMMHDYIYSRLPILEMRVNEIYCNHHENMISKYFSSIHHGTTYRNSNRIKGFPNNPTVGFCHIMSLIYLCIALDIKLECLESINSIEQQCLSNEKYKNVIDSIKSGFKLFKEFYILAEDNINNDNLLYADDKALLKSESIIVQSFRDADIWDDKMFSENLNFDQPHFLKFSYIMKNLFKDKFLFIDLCEYTYEPIFNQYIGTVNWNLDFNIEYEANKEIDIEECLNNISPESLNNMNYIFISHDGNIYNNHDFYLNPLNAECNLKKISLLYENDKYYFELVGLLFLANLKGDHTLLLTKMSNENFWILIDDIYGLKIYCDINKFNEFEYTIKDIIADLLPRNNILIYKKILK